MKSERPDNRRIISIHMQLGLYWAVLFVTIPIVSNAQNYSLKSHSLSNGAQTVSSSSYILNPSVGQDLVGVAASESYNLTAGFLPTAIPRQAELTITTIAVNPDELPAGEVTSLTFTVKNAGAIGIFGLISAKVYLSGNDVFEQDDILLDEFPVVTDLALGAELSFPTGATNKLITIPDTTTVGSYTLFVVLETENPIDEINPDNAFPVDLTVIPDGNGGDTAPPEITILPTGVSRREFSTSPINITITDQTGVASATFHYRTVSGEDFTEVDLILESGNNYTITPEESWADEIGMEAFVRASDPNDSTDETPLTIWYRTVDPLEDIPFPDKFDGKLTSYKMFSIPYELEDDDFLDIFNELGGYDPEKWRVFHYVQDRYVELLSGFNKIELGKGYWFNTTEDTTIRVGSGVITNNIPFTMTLTQGWNQIGNPYPFPVNWDQVKADNVDAGLNSLWVYDKGYDPSTTLEPWEGGFVWSDNGGPVAFTLSSRQSGRVEPNSFQWLSPDEDLWQIPISINQGDLKHKGAFGMHPDADLSKDPFDEMTVPRFIEYLEINSMHPEYIDPYFSYDIIPTTDTYEWTFTISSSDKKGEARISWDNQMLTHLRSAITLVDLQTLKVIDMKEKSEHTVRNPDSKSFRVYYSRQGVFNPGFTELGNAYPNPFHSSVTIPVLIDEPDKPITVLVYDASGRTIAKLIKSFSAPGLNQFNWDGRDEKGQEVSRGLLFYRLLETGSNETFKLIKN